MSASRPPPEMRCGGAGRPTSLRDPASTPAPARSWRNVTTDIRLMRPMTMIVDSTVRDATYPSETAWLTRIFTGCTTSVCVESTLRDAMFRDYRCLLLEDCTAEPVGNDLPRTNHHASVLVVEALFGRTTMSDDLLSALNRKV